MKTAVAARPMSTACTLASIAAAPRVGPTVRCSITSTGTGRAPPWTRAARSCASSWVKVPVICVVPPVMPTPQAICAPTDGEEMTSPSRTIAIRRVGSPGAAQAAWPVSCSHAT